MSPLSNAARNNEERRDLTRFKEEQLALLCLEHTQQPVARNEEEQLRLDLSDQALDALYRRDWERLARMAHLGKLLDRLVSSGASLAPVRKDLTR